MESEARTWGIQLLLLALAAFSSLNSPAAGSQLEVMSAPNLMRVGTDVNIFVEIQDYAGQNRINVPILVKNHLTNSKTLASTSVDLTKDGKYQGLGKVKISPEGFSTDPEVKQYVTLQAMFPGRILEKVVLVSFQSGYIFIQTDKTIYTPSSNIRYRVFALRTSMEPVVGSHQSDSESSVVIEIMTPDGIVVESKTVSLTAGIKSETYSLPSIVSVGQWKVVAKFQSNPQQSFFSEFEVKEYVLPSFEVKLSAPLGKPFFYVDSVTLTISIKATYVFGEEVDGTAYVVFGVMDEKRSEKRGLPKSLQRVPVQRGSAEATLTREQIIYTFPNINELVGSSIYVAVSVLTRSGGEMVESELRGIKIVTSPYTISFKRTPKFFKPGMSFDVLVEVLNPDGSPAPQITVEVDPGKVRGSTGSSGLARITIYTVADLRNLQITAKTKVDGLIPNRQATPYQTGTKSYLHISVDTAEVAIGQYIHVKFFLSKLEQNDITYLILSRGQLVHYFRYENNRQNQISQMVLFTKHMLPSFRIVAYYHTSSNELVSDSLWVDVQDICMGTLKLHVDGATASYEPRKTFKLVVTGDPEATVGLVAVDKSVYVLNNKHRLTQKTIWETVDKYEPGCTAGGGENSMKVFYDAGLLLETNSVGGTPDRTVDTFLPDFVYIRRKRASTIMDVRTSLLSEFKEKADRECCLDGMRDVPVSYTCERRAGYIVDDAPCAKAFLHCCQEMKKYKDENKGEVLQLARSEADDDYIDSDEIVSRSNFPESWHWTDVKLDPCPGSDPSCKTTQLEQYVPLPDSSTTWQLTGISLSSTHGICVADTLEVKVWKPFFIDLRLPYAAVRGEQLEIKAILHNYNLEAITVHVELKEDKSACSAAYGKGWFREEVQVGGSTTRSVPFIIIPMKDGEIPIFVRASVKYSYHGDAVEKTLRVVPPGVLVKRPFNVILDPAKKGKSGKQVETIKSEIPETEMVPNTPTSTLISLTGVEQMSSLFENSISGQSMGSLIKEPYGCGEQNMVAMTLPVIATVYLDKTNMWEDVGFAKRNQALQHIKSGYQTQLKYRKPEGSFAIFPQRDPSTWLTAYVAKVFAMSYKLVEIDTICGAIKFLILNAQQPDGIFREIGRVHDRNMIGDVGGVDTDASMTAFCLIAMQESLTLCSSSVNSMPNSIQKAVAYLERRLPRLTNPYAVAMTSYALANENKLNKQILFSFASSDQSHWPVPKGHIYTLEATAYALLALVKAQDFERAKNVVRWLSQQQKEGGGYGSTQATIMVYQAVAEYWANAKEPPYELDVDILLPGRSLADRYRINRKNHYRSSSSKFEGINKDVEVTAKGTGEAIFRMVSLYYAMPAKQERGCEMFNLNLELIPEKVAEDEKIFKLKIEILYKSKERAAKMTILDIGLPTGYSFNQNDLEALSSGKYPLISKFEMNKVLSERSSLMIYLDTVSNTRPDEVSFRIEQKMKVGVLQPAAVSVYEYYDRKHCVKFYRPERRDGELLRLCTSETCKCAEENCSKQKKENIDNNQRTNKACESTSTSKIDFVYKVNVANFQDGLNTDIFTMQVLKDIKVGSKDVAPRGKLRTFLSYQHCREALDLTVGKDFLIMGSSSDIYREDDSFQYVLGENSWIEYWPTGTECQSDKYRPICLGMEKLEQQFSIFGCQMK